MTNNNFYLYFEKEKGTFFYFSLLSLFFCFILSINFISAEEFGYNLYEEVGKFLDIKDTPDSYAGSATKCVKVNAGGTGLEFGACVVGGGGGDFSFANFQSSFDLNWSAISGDYGDFNSADFQVSFNSNLSSIIINFGDFNSSDYSTAFDSNWSEIAGNFGDFNSSDFAAAYANNFTLSASNTAFLNDTNVAFSGSLNATTDICITGGNCLSNVSSGGSGGSDNVSWNQSQANTLYISEGNLSIYNGLVNNFTYARTDNDSYVLKSDFQSFWDANLSSIIDNFGDFNFTDFVNSFDINISGVIGSFGDFNESDYQASFDSNWSAIAGNYGDFNSTDYSTAWSLNMSAIIGFFGDFNFTDFASSFLSNWSAISINYGDFNSTDFQTAFDANYTAVAGASMNYTNLALTNQTNYFNADQNISGELTIHNENNPAQYSEIYVDDDGNTIFT